MKNGTQWEIHQRFTVRDQDRWIVRRNQRSDRSDDETILSLVLETLGCDSGVKGYVDQIQSDKDVPNRGGCVTRRLKDPVT